MYAVIENGGKQYRVELGSELVIDRMDVEAGQTVQFDHVLLVADGDEASVGRPHVEGARVSADVVRQARGEKIVVFKYRPKARSRVKQGARADLTVLRIADIVHGGKSAAKAAEAARTERQRLEAIEAEAAAKQAEADKELARKLARATATAEAKATDKAKPAGAAKATPAKADSKAAAKPAKTAAKPAKPAAKAAAKRTETSQKTDAKPARGGKAPATRTQAPQPPAKPTPRKKKED
jgi:large subunit ribosomal protein L21